MKQGPRRKVQIWVRSSLQPVKRRHIIRQVTTVQSIPVGVRRKISSVAPQQHTDNDTVTEATAAARYCCYVAVEPDRLACFFLSLSGGHVLSTAGRVAIENVANVWKLQVGPNFGTVRTSAVTTRPRSPLGIRDQIITHGTPTYRRGRLKANSLRPGRIPFGTPKVAKSLRYNAPLDRCSQLDCSIIHAVPTLNDTFWGSSQRHGSSTVLSAPTLLRQKSTGGRPVCEHPSRWCGILRSIKAIMVILSYAPPYGSHCYDSCRTPAACTLLN